MVKEVERAARAIDPPRPLLLPLPFRLRLPPHPPNRLLHPSSWPRSMGGSSSRPPPKPVPPEPSSPCKKCGRIFTTPAGFARHKDSKSCADAVLWQQQQANGGGGDGSAAARRRRRRTRRRRRR